MSIPRTEPALEKPSEVGQAEEQKPSPPKTFDCDLCGKTFEGVPAGSGLFLWSRGEELRVEEPPLCEDCASQITIGALMKWDIEEEEEG